LGIAFVVWRFTTTCSTVTPGPAIERFQREERAKPASAQKSGKLWSQIDTALELATSRPPIGGAHDDETDAGKLLCLLVFGPRLPDDGYLTNAEAQFARAYELYPTEDQEKPLTAVRKRLAGNVARNHRRK